MTEISNDDIDLSQIDLIRPLIDNQEVLVRTGNVEIKDDKLVIPLTLEEPAVSTTGKPVNVGFIHTENLFLTPSPTSKKPDEARRMIGERLARFQVAALGLDAPESSFKKSDVASGRYNNLLLRVRFGLREDAKDASVQYQTIKAWKKAS